MSGKPTMDQGDLTPAERLRLAQDLEAAGGEPDPGAEILAVMHWRRHERDWKARVR